jgi:hypothetical protein
VLCVLGRAFRAGSQASCDRPVPGPLPRNAFRSLDLVLYDLVSGRWFECEGSEEATDSRGLCRLRLLPEDRGASDKCSCELVELLGGMSDSRVADDSGVSLVSMTVRRGPILF